MKRFLTLVTCLFATFPAAALELEKPIDCEIGRDCYVQNYVDMNPAREAQDFRCGFMSYNESKGTDFRLKNYLQMQQGVNVLAAAKGKVVGVRDGFEDININDINPSAVAGKECGNGVVIDHGDGWKTQYCHMQKNSIFVKDGQDVEAGTRLGRIGLSGDTSFPHMTLYVRHNEEYIDPFSARPANDKCSVKKPEFPLWSEKAMKAIPIVDSALLGMGFTAKKPEGELSRYGDFDDKAISVDSEMLVVWADVMGIQPNDILMLEIISPTGHKLIEHQKNFIDPKPQQFYFTGKKSEEGKPWEPGIYQGKLSLLRNKQGKSEIVLRKTIEAYIR